MESVDVLVKPVSLELLDLVSSILSLWRSREILSPSVVKAAQSLANSVITDQLCE